MRTTLLLAALAFGTNAVAQLPIPAFGSTHAATATCGFWFQAPSSFVITGLNVPNEANRAYQTVEVVGLGAAPPTFPGTVVGTQLFYSSSSAAGTPIACTVPVNAGDFIGVLGTCTSLFGNGTTFSSYAASPGPFISNINGSPVTLTLFGTDVNITAGGNNPCWQEPAGTISRVEVFIGSANGYAMVAPYGSGCYSHPEVSSYENFASGTFDLSNSTMSLLNTGTSYLAVPGMTAYMTPSASASVLALGDDAEAPVTLSAPMPTGHSTTTTTLIVCSNGFVSAGIGNGTGYSPIPARFLAGPCTWWCIAWHDLDPSSAVSGHVKFEEIAGVAYVTWDGVMDYGGTTAASANTFQAQFELATGNVHYVYRTMSNQGGGYLTGVSDGGTSPDPGSMDISAALPATFTAAQFAVTPLALTASARPRIGTSIALVSTHVPWRSPLGATLFGLTGFPVGAPLASLGMPGCSQYVSLDASMVYLPNHGTATQPFLVPNGNWLVGVVILAQSVAISPGANSLGVITSNGVRMLLDVQ